jgi:hypothetical protein
MKSWITKWKISNALDTGKPMPESLRRAIDADPGLQRFAQRAEAHGQTLRNLAPSGPPIHDAIMRAVRAAARQEAPTRESALRWWVASGALAAVTLVSVYWTYFRPKIPVQQAMDGPVRILEVSANIQAEMPALVMAPLSNEWAHVDHDLQSTTKVLMASLP